MRTSLPLNSLLTGKITANVARVSRQGRTYAIEKSPVLKNATKIEQGILLDGIRERQLAVHE